MDLINAFYKQYFVSKDKKKTVRFDDDQWHHVSIKRVAQEVRKILVLFSNVEIM